MDKKITYEEWVRNPNESKARIVGERDVAKNIYNDKYNKMILLCGGKIEYYLFHEDTRRYIIYLKMPSDNIKKLTYDVVVEFSTEAEFKRRINNLNGYRVKFFSNDPNFIFTYAYSYNKNGLICPFLKHKINEKALKEKPKITNPNAVVGYVKAFYFAYIFMQNKGLFNKLNWLQAGSIQQMNQILNRSVLTSDDKLAEINRFKQEQKNTKGKESIKTQDTATQVSKDLRRQIKTTNKALRSRTASSVRRVKKI